jgi:hypothetical protein
LFADGRRALKAVRHFEACVLGQYLTNAFLKPMSPQEIGRRFLGNLGIVSLGHFQVNDV